MNRCCSVSGIQTQVQGTNMYANWYLNTDKEIQFINILERPNVDRNADDVAFKCIKIYADRHTVSTPHSHSTLPFMQNEVEIKNEKQKLFIHRDFIFHFQNTHFK